ncbi:MAG: nucleoside 2-deoxyribosyltransferase [Cyanobacteria bacterium RM1_2_2]|nr:nucleoside 2-deoxyribosyltransferase [Cyanobacteria bacterium RM1_2_2]
MRIYLAGPDVFLPDPLKAAKLKQDICQRYGFVGAFPFDNTLDLASLSPFEAGIAIYNSNTELMDSCDLVIANMTPFRGPSMDVGTAFEMGYMAAKSKPVFGYTNDGRLYVERVTESTKGLDQDGLSIEAFEMSDNLMMEGAIFTSRGVLIRQQASPDLYYTELKAFEAAVQIAAERLL